ncbi:SLC13 family permease [Actinokineospora sp. NBRC 105648]|uniref:SLC13 family permease n=1 Tax=Actinokineospora sp. NBRC 105648 TaxID=3032206 RepID=UPI0024A2C5A1|nr:SLC13 family permease [Actinokineospora sp. NBRC 105648]GLZ39932.1 arsenic transporter [Actinokineospora sp. NBRC 105648]
MRIQPLDWVRIGLLALGVLFVLTGLLPATDAAASMRRIAPLLLFLASVIVLATLARYAQVFDVIATRLAILGRGNRVALFLLCAGFAALTTTILNLDTTAVLLTPVFLALAARCGLAPLPLAMTTIWLANTASLLLPVSNLTNLLAADRVAMSATEFAARMWLPQLVSIMVTLVFLWFCYWRKTTKYVPPEPLRPDHPVLCAISAVACVLFVAAIPIFGDAIGFAALGAALVVVAAFAVLDRPRLRPTLVPWRLLVLVTGLFLVVPTLGRLGLTDLVTAVVGTNPDALRVALSGAGLSNVVNNLPAYAAVEPAVPTDRLLALLVGANVGPIVTPWASLATLLCLEICRTHGLRVSLRRFTLTGLGLAAIALPACVGALLLTA